MNDRSLAGRTLRWTFTDGPTAGTTFEHVFADDGTVTFRDVKNPPPKESKKGPQYASSEVAPSTHIVSYLSPESGFTLTVAVNLETGRAYGFASNDKQWFALTGTAEE